METSSGENGPASWTARVLAPVALAAVVLVVALVISGSLGGDDDEDGGDRERERTAKLTGCEPSDPRAVEQGFYVLKSGENLSSVASATCISPERLARLNPNLDPQLLPVSACIDLVRDGCRALAPG
jgi:hypothetical protein